MGMEFLFLHMKIFRCCRSIPETAASEEFTQKGSAWKPDIGNVIEVAEETEQTICFGILRITFAHFAQDRFGFLAQGVELLGGGGALRAVHPPGRIGGRGKGAGPAEQGPAEDGKGNRPGPRHAEQPRLPAKSAGSLGEGGAGKIGHQPAGAGLPGSPHPGTRGAVGE